MRVFVKVILSKILLSVIALLVLNCSIEVQHPESDLQWDGTEFADDLSYNDIESVYELVGECWLGIEDLVPETNDDNSDEVKTGKNITWIIPYQQIFRYLYEAGSNKRFPYYIDHYISAQPDYYCPPPNHPVS